MDKAGYSFKKFKWDKNGYNQFKSSAGVRSMLQAGAERIKATAEAASGKEYRTDVEQSMKHGRPYAVVATDSADAARENAENNTLLKSINSGRL